MASGDATGLAKLLTISGFSDATGFSLLDGFGSSVRGSRRILSEGVGLTATAWKVKCITRDNPEQGAFDRELGYIAETSRRVQRVT